MEYNIYVLIFVVCNAYMGLVYMYVYVYLYVHMYACVRLCMCAYVCQCVDVYVYMHL